MTNNEANKVIAEYMDNVNPIPINLSELSSEQLKIYLPYIHCLDALVPVWKKIAKDSSRCVDINAFFGDESSCEFSVSYNGWFDESSDCGTAQESAAHATAKAILALEKRNE